MQGKTEMAALCAFRVFVSSHHHRRLAHLRRCYIRYLRCLLRDWAALETGRVARLMALRYARGRLLLEVDTRIRCLQTAVQVFDGSVSFFAVRRRVHLGIRSFGDHWLRSRSERQVQGRCRHEAGKRRCFRFGFTIGLRSHV